MARLTNTQRLARSDHISELRGCKCAGACARLPSLGIADHVLCCALFSLMKNLWVRGDGAPKGIYGPARWSVGVSRRATRALWVRRLLQGALGSSSWADKLENGSLAMRPSDSLPSLSRLEAQVDRARQVVTSFRRRPPPCPNIRQDSPIDVGGARVRLQRVANVSSLGVGSFLSEVCQDRRTNEYDVRCRRL